jgi:CheY-like chemotaxis protein
MRVVVADGAGSDLLGELSAELVSRGHAVVRTASVWPVAALPADWFLIDGTSGFEGALDLALMAARSARVAIVTRDGLRCIDTWELLPHVPERCADALLARGPRRLPVLVAEDDDDTRESVVEVLSAEGLSVIQARDGEEALRCLSDGPAPSLLLLDVMMPRLDGFGVLQALRSRVELAHVPVVLATCLDDERLPRDVPRLRKPLRTGPLLAAVHRYRGVVV